MDLKRTLREIGLRGLIAIGSVSLVSPINPLVMDWIERDADI
jgi:hypothetical protein